MIFEARAPLLKPRLFQGFEPNDFGCVWNILLHGTSHPPLEVKTRFCFEVWPPQPRAGGETVCFLHKIFVFYFSKRENYLSRSGYWRNRFWINDWTVAVLCRWSLTVLCRWSLTKLGVLSCLNSLSLPPYLPAYRPIHRIYIEYRYKDINIKT